MKTIFYNFSKYLSAFLVLFIFSCETIDTDLTEDPNNLGPDEASIEFLFNRAQIQFASYFENLQFLEAQVSRMELMRNSPFYASQFDAGSFDDTWVNAYVGVLNQTQQLKKLAADIETEEINANNVIAAAQILEAYTITTLVDTFNEVPYSEALQGSDNFDPKRDSGESIYAAARALLLDAIVKIDGEASIDIPNDLYFGGNMTRWKALANSLLLKLAVNSRLNNADAASQANAIINGGDFIATNSGDFQFNYSSASDPAESRHPIFTTQYIGGASIYMTNAFLDRMAADPRFNYYFYQQDGPGGLEGREHGDAGPSVASEFPRITIHGLYPVGGQYNDGSTGAGNQNDGVQGAGASIIMTHAFTRFLIAEAQLMLNNNPAAAKTAMLAGVNASIDKVRNFRPSAVPTGTGVTQAEVDAYLADVSLRFDEANNQQEQLDVIISEYYKSLWGNGIEAYNNLRRTGYPSDLSPSIAPNPGPFTNSMLYPSIYINNNNNPDSVQRTSVGEKVWWAEGTTFNLDF